jgi:hypothetical protein
VVVVRGWTARPSRLPWGRPRFEFVLLVLVACSALSVVYPFGAQDVSRLCLTRALVHGRVSADSCLSTAQDRAEYRGHFYSDKAPGYSFLAVPAALIVGLPAPAQWHKNGDLRLWFVRLTTGGVAFIFCAFLVGRVAEGLQRGTGGAVLVTFGLGTLVSSMAVASFDHVPAAALTFAAFLLAWARRPLSAGLVAGFAVVVEYEAGLVALLIGGYILMAGVRPLARFALGLLPGAMILGAYDWAAFGSPFHLSYRYVANGYTADQEAGFFGIHSPSWNAIRIVVIGSRGLLVASPVLAAAALGLLLLWRRGRQAEAALCAAVTLAFLAIEWGYFDPFGGDAPGPRFFIPALPFVALGLAPAFARLRRTTSILAALSVIASTAVALTWPTAVNSGGYRGTVWRGLADLVAHGRSSSLAVWAQKNVLDWADIGRLGSAAIASALALTALTFTLKRDRTSE